jgi:uncharacterized BrkB/YihY/UPF0761 family membrane protein
MRGIRHRLPGPVFGRRQEFYGSVFGALATFVVVLTYLFVASCAVLTGAEIHAVVIPRAERRR